MVFLGAKILKKFNDKIIFNYGDDYENFFKYFKKIGLKRSIHQYLMTMKILDVLNLIQSTFSCK